VVVVTTERRDVPVALKGIGIVQAYNTVTVKPRISGQLMQVVFTEGQQVHQGDVLARIDSRFLIAQLHQAQATRARMVPGRELRALSFITSSCGRSAWCVWRARVPIVP
jgi:multidrug efflux pump subunit AcrA (membrane-fusion protein)